MHTGRSHLCRLCLSACAHVLQEYPWIESEKQFFGRPGSNYDWAATDPQQAFADHEKAADMVDRLDKKVNRKVGRAAHAKSATLTGPCLRHHKPSGDRMTSSVAACESRHILNYAPCKQVLQMFDKAEQEFKDLSEKKRIVANDKQKIHRVRARRCRAATDGSDPKLSLCGATVPPVCFVVLAEVRG